MGRPAPPRPAPPSSKGKSARGGAADAGPLAVAEGTVVAGKYRLDRPLRRGGMGSVWVATHLALDTPVAIKFMAGLSASIGVEIAGDGEKKGEQAVPPSSGSLESRSRFEREAKAAAQIRSANVVQILDYGVDREAPYIVMELLQGEDLGVRLKRVGRMSLQDVSRLVVSVARALQRAHDAGLVHRDLKPANIFLAREGDEEVPKVLDFGVAKAVRDRPVGEGTLEGTMVGTPSFMSPEQAMGRSAVDHRADLWSLGVIVYRALTGARPFESESLLELVVQICSHDAPRATQIAPDLPPAIDGFLERALQRDPEKRFQSAKEMARAFAAIAPPRSSMAPPARGPSGAPPPGGGAGALEERTLRMATPEEISEEHLIAARPIASSVTSEPSYGSSLSSPDLGFSQEAGTSSRRRLAIAAGAGALAAVVLVVAVGVRAATARHEAPPASSAASSAMAPSTAAALVTSTDPTAEPAPSVAAVTPSANGSPPIDAKSGAPAAPAVPAKPPRGGAPRAPSNAKPADCSAPYYWDSDGTKHIKPQCL